MNEIIYKCNQLCEIILENRKIIEEIILGYQPKKVVDYEIDRSIYTLRNICKNNEYFKNSVDYISVFLPFNLPLYSLILFGVIPYFMTNKRIYIKPNSEMRERKLIENLVEQLQINKNFSKICLISNETDYFIKKWVPQSDVVIFTGYNKNRDKIMSLIKPGGLLIYNGSGHNPIVVSHDANLDKAVSDACFSRFFNSGQDCAGPDSILVHTSIFGIFLKQYLDEVKKLTVGNYHDAQVDIGPINRKSELKKFLDILYSVNPDEIVMGGGINLKKKIVEPTVIVRDLSKGANFKEIFGPIAFIHPYTRPIAKRLNREIERER